MINTPNTVPEILPEPPAILVPPRTTAAIASISALSPAVCVPENRREDEIIPAREARILLYTNTNNVTTFVLTPEYAAACILPPVARMWRPSCVRFRITAVRATTITI